MAKIDRASGKGKVQTLAADNTNRLITEGVLRELLIDLWDSGALQIDEETFFNLQDLADRDYRVGECMVYDNGQGFKIFRATTAGGGIPFVAANWELLTSSGGTANTLYSADGVISGTRIIQLPSASTVFWNGGAENSSSVLELSSSTVKIGGQSSAFTEITGGLQLNPIIPQNTSLDPVRILAYDPVNFVTKYINSNEIAGSNIYTADGELSGVRSLTGNQGRGLFQSFFDADIATFNQSLQLSADSSNYRVQLLSGDGTGSPTGSIEFGLDSSGLNFFNSFGTGIGYTDNGSYSNVDWYDIANENKIPSIKQTQENTKENFLSSVDVADFARGEMQNNRVGYFTGGASWGLFAFDTDPSTYNTSSLLEFDSVKASLKSVTGNGSGGLDKEVSIIAQQPNVLVGNGFGFGSKYVSNSDYANVDWNDPAFANYLPCIQQVKDNTISSDRLILPLSADASIKDGSGVGKFIVHENNTGLNVISTNTEFATSDGAAYFNMDGNNAVFSFVNLLPNATFDGQNWMQCSREGIHFRSEINQNGVKYNQASDYANVDWNDSAFANHIPSIQQVKDNVGGGIVDIVSGSSNVAIAETGTPGVKSIEVFQTTAGLLANVYFTGQEITTTEGNFYETLIGERGNVASQTQTVVLASNQTEAFAQDFLGEVQPEEGAVVSGVYAAFPIMQVSSNQNNQRFKIEAYICDGEGVPTGVGDGPVGTLGVNTILIADSGIIDLQANNPTNVNCQGDVENSIPILAGERFRYVVIAERVGSGSANKTVTFFAGSDYNSYFQIPNPSLSPAASKSIDRLEWYVEGAISSTTPVNEFVARRNSAFSTLRGRYFAGNTLSQVIGIKATTGNLAAGGAIGGSAFKVQIRYDDEGSPTQHVYGGGTLLTEQDVFVSPDVGIGTLNSVSNEISFEGIPLVPDKVYFVEISDAGSFVINDLSIEVLTETKTSPSTFLF